MSQHVPGDGRVNFIGVGQSQMQGRGEVPFEGVVTPEAVVLEFETAGVGSRTAAAIVDFAVRGIVLTVVAIAAGLLDAASGVLDGWIGVTFLIFMIFFLTVGYGAFFETVWNGKTPGKAMLGLRVVTTDGAPITFRHAAIRAALALPELIVTSGFVAVVAVFLSQRNQRLGDMIAGTLVLRERQAQRAPVATQFLPPPGTEQYASTLDVSVMSGDEYLVVRSYLMRSGQMSQQARYELSAQLGRQFAAQLNTQPPYWMPAEVFLICLAAAYQRRFSA